MLSTAGSFSYLYMKCEYERNTQRVTSLADTCQKAEHKNPSCGGNSFRNDPLLPGKRVSVRLWSVLSVSESLTVLREYVAVYESIKSVIFYQFLPSSLRFTWDICCLATNVSPQFHQTQATVGPLTLHLQKKSVKLNKSHKVSPAEVHGCKTWSVTQRKEHRLWAVGNEVLRRIFGHNGEEVTGGQTRLYLYWEMP